MKHFKTDLLTDEQMSDFQTKTGDIISLNVPTPGTVDHFTTSEHHVIDVAISDAGEHEGVHYTRVTLTLESL